MSTYITKRAADLDIKVVDAKTPLVVEVQAADIARATAKNSKCCAFVRACERSMPIQAAFFFRSTAWLEYEDKIVRYKLPPSVQKEIVTFDRTKTVEPGMYHLSAVNPKGTLKAKAERRAKQKAAGGGSHVSKGIVPKGRKVTLIHRTAGIRTNSEPSYRAAK